MEARLIDIQLSFQIVADDGKLLHRVKVNPIMMTAAQIDALPQAVRDVLAQVQQQLDAQTNTPPA